MSEIAPKSIRDLFFAHGFVAVGTTSADPWEVPQRVRRWLDQGYHGGREYLRRHLPLKGNPASLLEGAQGILVGAYPYGVATTTAPPLVAGYAHGPDYHLLLREKLTSIGASLFAQGTYRAVVDSAPLAERHVAVQAGVGFIGLSGNLIVPGVGPNVFLGSLITTRPLPVLQPPLEATCGECRRCVEACPTGALLGDGTLDARLCLSAYTTDLRALPPREVAQNYQGRLFGCETCVAVCPHTRDRDPLYPSPVGEQLYWQLPQLPKRVWSNSVMGGQSKKRVLANLALSLVARGGDPRTPKLLEQLARAPEPLVRESARLAQELLARTRTSQGGGREIEFSPIPSSPRPTGP